LDPRPAPDTIRVLLVDDHEPARRGLRMRLGLEPDLAVVGEATNGVDAVPLALEVQPDVVLMDVAMAGGDGVTATADLRGVAPHVAVVVLSLYDDAPTRRRARAAGAVAFVAKHEADLLLLPTIRQVASR
jgi:DNA-binding NarL/FixJ family response regulator